MAGADVLTPERIADVGARAVPMSNGQSRAGNATLQYVFTPPNALGVCC